MRMIPSQITENTKSNAERSLFREFQNLKRGAFDNCFHSINLPEHKYKALGEIDFVLLGPRGLFVLEVKGGGVRRERGMWEYTDRWGHITRSSEGPFRQARSAMYSLRNRMAEIVPHSRLDKITMGYGVVFPDCVFDVRSVEWSPVLILDADRMRSQTIKGYLSDLEEYWHRKFPSKPAEAGSNTVRELVRALRPDFELIRSLRIEADRIEGRMVRMTDEQYTRLDIIEQSPRILVNGGAGTGKTFLAAEVARRHAVRGEEVLLVCFSPLLARFLERLCDGHAIRVAAVHELMMETVVTRGQLPPGFARTRALTDSWYLEALVPAFEEASRSITEENMYDLLVIDEGQDILNLEYLTALERLLRGGLEKGTWRIFYDSQNQGAIFGAVQEDIIDLLSEFSPVTPRLSINCRNTDEIVLQTKLLTGADMGNRSTGPGPKVSFAYFQDEQEAAELLKRRLETLQNHNVPGSDITILSPRPYADSSARLLPGKWRRRLRRYDGPSPAQYPADDLSFATVAGFKGLENRFILLTDIYDVGTTSQARATVYVGMSRARAALWMAVEKSQKPHQKELSEMNLKELF